MTIKIPNAFFSGRIGPASRHGKSALIQYLQQKVAAGTVLPYSPELEQLGERYGVHRFAGESAATYGQRVIATIVAAHDRNASLTTLIERDLDRAVHLLAHLFSLEK